MRYAFISLLFIFLLIPESNADVPRESLKYKRELIRQSRIIWGLNAPIPLFASQIHQESTWNHLAKSKYAKGLTQFTDSTAEWMIEIFPQLKRANVYNPNWSIRAMLLYDSWLDDRIKSIDDCNQWAMILSSYNGGLTWLNRDKALAEAKDSDPNIWWNNVEKYSNRADWAIRENRNYSKSIIFKYQNLYADWGKSYICNIGNKLK
jgi:soluble lytic murein transglycosylase-like protein